MKKQIKEEYCYPEHWIKEGRKQAIEEFEKMIDEWRVQLEDVGFVTIDKHFVDELKAQIKEMK